MKLCLQPILLLSVALSVACNNGGVPIAEDGGTNRPISIGDPTRQSCDELQASMQTILSQNQACHVDNDCEGSALNNECGPVDRCEAIYSLAATTEVGNIESAWEEKSCGKARTCKDSCPPFSVDRSMVDGSRHRIACINGACGVKDFPVGGVGAICGSAQDCVSGLICESFLPFPDGSCTKACDGGCPAGSACGKIALNTPSGGLATELCMQQCAQSDACRPGYLCCAVGGSSVCFPGSQCPQ